MPPRSVKLRFPITISHLLLDCHFLTALTHQDFWPRLEILHQLVYAGHTRTMPPTFLLLTLTLTSLPFIRPWRLLRSMDSTPIFLSAPQVLASQTLIVTSSWYVAYGPHMPRSLINFCLKPFNYDFNNECSGPSTPVINL